MANDREKTGTEEVYQDDVSAGDIGAALEALHTRLTTGGDCETPSLAGLNAEELLRVMRLQERLVQLEHARVAEDDNSAEMIGPLNVAPRDSTQTNPFGNAETPRPAADSRGVASAEALAAFEHTAIPAASNTANRGVIGRFEVLRVLGRGGQGLMLLANDPVLGRKVALKVPWSETLITPQLRRRFLREARAVARLTHPHIVPVYEVGELGPICFIASAFVEGPSLAERLESRNAPLSPHQAAAIVADLADAIQYAHSQGVLHRDLKPANVLLEAHSLEEAGRGASWVAKLTDFGLAKILDLAGDETRSGALIGTPAYMSPEQAKADHAQVGPASDVYSLGAILYELLTGCAAFRAESEAETLRRVIMEPAASTRRLRADVPADLDAICLKCLEKDPASRYASAADFAADLRRYLAGEPTHARPLSAAARLTRWAGRNRRVAALLGLVAVLLVGMTGISTVAAIRINDARRNAEQHVVELTKRDAFAREQVNVAQFNRAYVTGDLVIGRRVIDDLRQDGHRLDEFEWRLLKEKLRGHVGAIDRPGTNEAVISLVYAPDGRALVAGTDKGNLFTWNARTLEPLGVTKAHDVCVNSIHLSPDGEMAATTSCDKLVKLWNTKSWECVGELVGHTHEVGACAFSPDGKLLVSGTRQQDNQRVPAGEFRLWDVATRECLSEWRCELNTVYGMSFINDRAVVACFRDGEILQWDISTRPPQSTEVSFDTPTLLQRPEIAERSFTKNTLIPSADRRYLAFFDGFGEAWSPTWNKLMLVDLGSGETRKLAEGRYERAIGAFSPDSRLLAAVANEDSPRIYSTTTGSLLHDFGPGRRGALAFSADGRSLAISRWNGPINIHDITVPNEIHHRLPGGRVTICPDTRHVFCSFGDESRLEIYDLVTGQCISERQPTKGHSVGLDAISPNERRASYNGNLSGKPAVAVVDLENPNGVMTLGPRHGAPIFLADDLLAVESTSDVKTYDLRTGEIVKQFPFPEELVGEYGAILDAIPNGRRIGIAFHRDIPDSVFILDTDDGSWLGIAHHYRNVRLSRDGKYVAAFDGDTGIQISDAETGAKLQEVLVPTRHVVSADFSPDSRTLAGVCSDGTLRLWRVTTGQELCTLAKFAERPEYCRFSSDGSTLIASAGHGGENGEWDVFVFIAAPERENCEQQ